MSNHNFFTVSPHLNTTNLYVQKEILNKNIFQINQTLDNRVGLNISNKMFWDIVLLKKKQVKFLKDVNYKIAVCEQASFPFGNPLI